MPPELLTCKSEPVPGEPAGAGGKFTDAQAAGYLVDALEAGASCRGKLAAVKAWSDQQ